MISSTYSNTNTNKDNNPIVQSQSNPQVIPVTINDTIAMNLARKFLTKDEISRMLYRVTRIPDQSKFTPHRLTTDQTITGFTNWTGYAVQNSNALGVQAHFNAETYSGPGGSYGGEWVGLGNNTIAQTGLETRQMMAFYEFYPAVAVYLFSVNAGDEMGADVSYDSGTGLWYVYVGDLTTGKYYTSEFSVSVDRSFAEWITETDGNVGTWNPVNFTQCTWLDSNGATSTSAIGSDGQSFTTYDHS